MAFDVSTMTAYTKVTGDLIAKAVLGAETIKNGGVTIIPGIKYKQRLDFLQNTIYLQAESCGWTSGGSGTTTLSEKDITVVPLKNQLELCPSALLQNTQSIKLKPGYNKEIPFEGLFAENYVANIALTNETMIWANTAASSTACEGYLHAMLADSDVNDVTTIYLSTSGTTMTATNWLAAFNAMYNALPVKYQAEPDLTLYIGQELYNRWAQAMVVGNFYKDYDVKMVPGFNIKIFPTNGLNSTNYMVLTPSSNLIVGVDQLGEDENVNIRWDESQEMIKVSAHYKIGTSYYFGDAIVLGR